MKTIQVQYTQTRMIGLLASTSLLALSKAYRSEGLQIKYRKIPVAQSNFGYQRKREAL